MRLFIVLFRYFMLPILLAATARSAEQEGQYRFIPAAAPTELTAANGWPQSRADRNWSRSLGGPTSDLYSELRQITPANVGQLQVAWTYHSGDGAANLQCNPIIVDGVMLAPTAGHRIVALDAATGRELWRFKPAMEGHRLEDTPARRGLIYWPGDGSGGPRILFGAGYWIYALDPATGKPIQSFGHEGRTALPAGATANGAIWHHILVVPGFNRDVFGYDVVSGATRWRFHTIPLPGEFGFDTWNKTEKGANDWGGMAMDESRGIAYISTGSPKPNFNGTGHLGPDLFGNCVIALRAETGERLWHFQEIRHDIWDLDLPAPPNLVTVMHDGRKVDAVAQVTKIGNTLLLDRVTGLPLFPFRLRRAPASHLEGEQTAPYQPDALLSRAVRSAAVFARGHHRPHAGSPCLGRTAAYPR
jgi:quinoprotein glucose dehydrogenase